MEGEARNNYLQMEGKACNKNLFVVGLEGENVSRLAIKRLADRIQGLHAHRLRFAILENGEIGIGNTD